MTPETTKVAVTSIVFRLLPYLREEITCDYPDAKFNEDKLRFTDDELIDFLQGYDVAVIGLERFNENVVSSLPDLKAVACCSVGADHIDPTALKKHGVGLGWIPGINKISVAELTIGFMIDLLRKVNIYNTGLRNGEWPQNKMGAHLRGRTVGIHGCGNIGQELVRLLQPFGVDILASDRADYDDFYAAHGVTAVSPEELRARSEIVTLHLPKNSTTIGLYDEDTLDQLRPGAFLINTSRGGIVDEDALRARLEDGRIAGAAFDVFAVEPATAHDSRLMALPNMLATPHMGGSAKEAWEAMGRAGIKGITENAVPEPGVYPFD